MENGNKHVCWGYRVLDHCIWDFPMRQVCPTCGKGFVTLMKVVHVKESMGKFFHSCTMRSCDHFEWVNLLKPKQEHPQPEAKQKAENCGKSLTKASSSAEIESLSQIFSTVARISHENDVEVSLNATFRKLK